MAQEDASKKSRCLKPAEYKEDSGFVRAPSSKEDVDRMEKIQRDSYLRVMGILICYIH